MKKLVLFLTLLCTATPVFAAADPDAPLNFYTVDAKLSTAAKSVFGLDEKPWVYFHIPDQHNGGTNWRPFALTLFDSPDANNLPNSFDFEIGAKSDREFWLSPRGWNTVKEVGEWTVGGSYFYFNNALALKQSGSATTSFTVTPEPASMLLFGLGAAGLGLAGIRRKNS